LDTSTYTSVVSASSELQVSRNKDTKVRIRIRHISEIILTLYGKIFAMGLPPVDGNVVALLL